MIARLGRLRSRSRDPDEGFTLVELMVAMFLFAVVLALVASATVVMARSLRKQQAQSDNLDGSRKVINLLDRQVRYANAITQPGPNTAGTATYVEWQTGDTNQPQTCYQWKLDSASGVLAYRTWPATTMVATAWNNEAFGAVAIAGTPVFQTTADPGPTGTATATPTASASAGPIVTSHAALTITFGLTHGSPVTTTKSAVTLAAIGTTGTATPANTCAVVKSAGGAVLVTRP